MIHSAMRYVPTQPQQTPSVLHCILGFLSAASCKVFAPPDPHNRNTFYNLRYLYRTIVRIFVCTLLLFLLDLYTTFPAFLSLNIFASTQHQAKAQAHLTTPFPSPPLPSPAPLSCSSLLLLSPAPLSPDPSPHITTPVRIQALSSHPSNSHPHPRPKTYSTYAAHTRTIIRMHPKASHISSLEIEKWKEKTRKVRKSNIWAAALGHAKRQGSATLRFGFEGGRKAFLV
ncbi:hypothetical protein ONS96_005052 [Cadophora gregata f. sp. sojae]|nr:hypothetical protein ONS96_005052 [Cadophora gregata f. sp. sojae]